MHTSLLHDPEAHEQLQQRGFAAAAAPNNADDRMLRHRDRHVGEHHFPAIRECNVLCIRAGKCNVRLPRHFSDDRRLVEDVQHAISGSKRALKRAAEIRQCDHRPEGREECKRRDEHTVEANSPGAAERRRGEEHRQIKQQNDRVRCRGIAAGDTFETCGVLRKRVGLRIHLRQPLCPLPVLYRLRQAAQTVEHKRRELARFRAAAQAGVLAAARRDKRDNDADCHIRRQRQQPKRPMIMPDKQAHAGTEQQHDYHRGDRVRVEHLKQLDVRRDDRNEIALVASLKLGRTEPAQRAEHLIADAREELEGDEMVARLLRIAKSSAQHRKYEHARKQRPQSQRYRKMQQLQQCITAKDRDQRRAGMPEQAHCDGKEHISYQRTDKSDEPGHNGKTASLLHSTAPSFA